jgi:hypothetical protein
MTNSSITSSFTWWEARRLRYNRGLVVGGILAFIAYSFVGTMLLPDSADFEVTIFTTFFQGVGYLIMIGVANLFFFLGPVSERVVNPINPERYRNICYCMGYWFSVLLPFSIPILLAVLAIFYPSIWSHSL